MYCKFTSTKKNVYQVARDMLKIEVFLQNYQTSAKEIRLDLHGVGQNIANLLSFTLCFGFYVARSIKDKS